MLDELSPEREIELRREVEADRLARDTEEPSPSALQAAKPVNTSIHHGVFRLFTGLFAVVLTAFYLTFHHDAETVFMIVVCALYGVMYFGTPVILSRIAREQTRQRWSQFLSERISVSTGSIMGRTALLQICIIPAALTVCVIGVCVIIAVVR